MRVGRICRQVALVALFACSFLGNANTGWGYWANSYKYRGVTYNLGVSEGDWDRATQQFPPHCYLRSVSGSASVVSNLTIPTALPWDSHGSAGSRSCPIISIPATAFRNWSPVYEVTLSSEIKSIGIPAFWGCNNLRAFHTTPAADFRWSGTGNYVAPDGVLYLETSSLAGRTRTFTLVKYPEGKAGTTFVVTSAVTRLADRCFANTKLSTITFMGNAPSGNSTVFSGSDVAILYQQGASGWSNPWCGKNTFAIPKAVTDVKASQGESSSQTLVSWAANAVATSYAIFRSESASGTKVQIGTVSSGSTAYADSQGSPGKKYYYWVQAVNGPATGGMSASAIGWRTIPTSPSEGKGFWARLSIPDPLIKGQESKNCFVEYGNSGTNDISVSVLQISMTGDGTLGYIDGLSALKTLQFVAAGNADNAGVLRPGETHRIYFTLKAGTSNTISLQSSLGSTYAPSPWTSAEDYLTDVAKATSRIGQRMQNATDYANALILAKAIRNGASISAVYGRLVDAAGEGIEGIVVNVSNSITSVHCVTGSQGLFCSPNLADGNYEVCLGDGVLSHARIQVTVAGNDIQLGDVIAEKGGTITVTLVDALRDSVILYGLPSEGDPISPLSWNNEAEAVFSGIPIGSVTIECVNNEGIRKSTVVHIVEGGEKHIEFNFSKNGEVLLNFSSMGMSVPTGFLVYDGTALERIVVLHGDSTYLLDEIAPGNYSLVFFSNGGILEDSLLIEVPASEISNGKAFSSKAIVTRARTNYEYLRMVYDFFGPEFDALRKQANALLAAKLSPPKGVFDCEYNRELYAKQLSLRNRFIKEYAVFNRTAGVFEKSMERTSELVNENIRGLAVDTVSVFFNLAKKTTNVVKAGSKVWEVFSRTFAGYEALSDGSMSWEDWITAATISAATTTEVLEALGKVGMELSDFTGILETSWSIANHAGGLTAGLVATPTGQEEADAAYRRFLGETESYEQTLSWTYEVCAEENVISKDQLSEIALLSPDIWDGQQQPWTQDLVIVIDSTGSMGGAIDSAKASARTIVEKVLGATGAGTGNRVAIVEYRDQGDDFVYRARAKFTANASTAIAAINGIEVDGGDDIPEALYATLRAVVEGLVGDWRNVHKNIIVMTDAPPHDPDPVSGDTKESIARLLSGKNAHVSRKGVQRGAKASGASAFQLHFVYVQSDAGTLAIYRDLTETTGGTFQSGVNPDEAADAIIEALEEIEEMIFDPIWHFEIRNGGAVVENVEQAIGDVTIPDTLDGVPVTGIGNTAFDGASYLISLIIPSSVTSIGDSAFRGCSSLTTLTIPGDVTSIGKGVFSGCDKLVTLIVPKSWEGTGILDGAGVPAGCTIVYETLASSFQTVTFNANGGRCGTNTKVYRAPGKYTDLPTATKSGHGFLGWFTAAEGGKQVTTNHNVTAATERTLYAHWTDKQVTTFSGNGGTPSKQVVTNIIASKYGEFPAVSWADHVFKGWFDASEGGERVTANSTVTQAAKRTLYAHWTDEQVTTFRWNDGTTNATVKTNTMGKAYGTMPVPKWAGHAFLGWFTASTGGTEVKGTNTVTVTTKRTLYAHWTDKQVTTFDGNGGTPSTQVATNTVGTKYGELPAVSRANHVFQGWYDASEGGTRVTANTTVTQVSKRTLYAHWTDRQATTFRWNDGTTNAVVRTNTMGQAYGTMPAPKWAGHAFLGWFTASNGGSEVKGTNTVTVTTKRTLYAHWTDKQVTTFDGNGGTPSTQVVTNFVGTKYGELPAVSWTNHVFQGWYDAAEGGTRVTANTTVTQVSKRTLYARWTNQQVTSFRVNDGTTNAVVRTNTMGQAYGTMPEPKWAGHAFLGWFTASNGGSEVKGTNTVTVTTKRTLYAHWTDKQVTTFDGNGGTPATQVVTNTVGTKYGELPAVSWTNHVFQGWYDAAEGGTRVTANTTVTQVSKRTLYAHWTDRQATTFRWNDGTTNAVVRTNTMGQAYGTMPVPKWAGHAFLGWFTASNGGSEVKGTNTVTVTTKRTLYAHWTDKQVTTFDGNGGTPATQVVTNTVGTKYGELPAVSWTNHVFQGWYDAAEGGTRVTANTTVTQVSKRTLYAHWTDRQATTFRWNDGTTNAVVRTNTMGQAYGTMPVPKWAGHAFLGWFTASTGGSEVKGTNTVPVVAKRTLHAHWTTNQTVTFEANGGTCDTETKTVAIGGKYGPLPTPAWNGHKFLGWFTAEEEGSRVTANTTVWTVAEKTLWAHWSETTRGLSISGFAVKKAGSAAARGDRPAPAGAILSFEAEAGRVYELQWTPVLGGEWMVLKRWTADEDGETSVEVPAFAGATTGFYRLATPAATGE